MILTPLSAALSVAGPARSHFLGRRLPSWGIAGASRDIAAFGSSATPLRTIGVVGIVGQ
jgi:hypothetical protein